MPLSLRVASAGAPQAVRAGGAGFGLAAELRLDRVAAAAGDIIRQGRWLGVCGHDGFLAPLIAPLAVLSTFS